MPIHYVYLVIAVAAETVGTSSIQASQQFTRIWPSLLAIGSFVVAFYFLGLTLKYMPVGIMYALWSGLGIIFIALIGWTYFGQRLDFAAVAGMGLIVAGIVVINVFSNTATH